ncbi:MAG: hypothetical protein NZM35_01955 [Chitinophagales bacterium]|nr:hypothetical protein [Chitinophagales bacterium]MDW8418232.1 hypothetical protein [Chitinophagales bacterium]
MELLISDMGITDVLLTLLYLLFAYGLALGVVNRNKDRIHQLYYLKGFNYKIIATLFFASIYVFYYAGGDSLAFYGTIKSIYNIFFNDPSQVFSFIYNPYENYPSPARVEAGSYGVQYLTRGYASLMVIRIGFLLDLISFNSYWALCIVFAVISYYFTWKFFLLLCEIYPNMHKEFALAVLYIPSVLFWGSGLAKDTIMTGSIFFFFYCSYRLLINRRRPLYYFFLLVVTGYIIFIIRSFILLTIVPCIILMITVHYRTSIRNSILRFLITPFLIVGGLAGSYYAIVEIGSSESSYNLEALEYKATGFRTWHTTQGGSTYSLGGDPDDVSLPNLLKQTPLALVYSLFGPFIWQVRNPVMLLSALESMALLYFTLGILLRTKLWRIYEIIISEPLIAYALPFCIVLAIAIGLTSFNFGALVRYRIPILPFYVIMLVLMRYRLGYGNANR